MKCKSESKPAPEIKLVYSAKKKLIVKNMACRRAESKEWSFNDLY